MGMPRKEALKSLKTFCGPNMTKELEELEESLRGWELRDEHREASLKAWMTACHEALKQRDQRRIPLTVIDDTPRMGDRT